jgi:hypothetical protein
LHHPKTRGPRRIRWQHRSSWITRAIRGISSIRPTPRLWEAEKRFKKLSGAGFTAAKRLGEGKSEVIRSFEPTAEETLFIPRLQDG